MSSLYYYQFDANLFISYLLNENDLGRAVRSRLYSSNPGNSRVVITTSEVGEITKRLLKEYKKDDLPENIYKNISSLSKLVRDKRIKILRLQDIIKSKEDSINFLSTFRFLNDTLGFDDNRIQMNDRLHLSFFALTKAKIYYTADGHILNSTKIIDHFKKKYSKDIKELDG